MAILEREGDSNFLFLKLGDTFIMVLNTVSSPQG